MTGRIGDAATTLLDAPADRVPAGDLADYRELYQAGEWEELANVLATHLDTEHLPLNPEETDHPATLGAIRPAAH